LGQVHQATLAAGNSANTKSCHSSDVIEGVTLSSPLAVHIFRKGS
jgi:hypothetical protein